MTQEEKNALREKIGQELTSYENSDNTAETGQEFLEVFYSLLVRIYNELDD